MLKNFKSGYEVSGSNATAKKETNDCVVRAIANACDVNYNQAHKYVADKFDRKKGKGTQMFMSTLDNVNQMSFDEVGQLNMFNEGIVRSIKSLGKGPEEFGTFEIKKQKGNFLLAVNKHALAIKDGVVIDNGNYQFDGYRRVVEGAYQIK